MNLRLKSLVCDVYYLLFFTFSFPVWAFKLLTRRSWRDGFKQRLGFVKIQPPAKPRIWVHGVSVGEILAGRGVIAALSADPRFEVAVSTTTRTGFAVASKNFPSLPVFHFPLDLSGPVKRIMRRVKPSLIVMVELEVWPNFLLRAAMLGVPVAFVNCRITRRSAESYRFLHWLLKPLMAKSGLFCSQNAEYASRLSHLGARADALRITGNLKYDNLPAAPSPEAGAPLREKLGFAPGEIVLVGGSVHPGEDEALVRVFASLSKKSPSLRLVMAPRHPERFARAAEVTAAAGLECFRRTAGTPVPGSRPVILLDTMGELASVYAAADVVFVGGSLIPHGGQNMMEPAALGKAVVFGPHVHNFREDSAFLLLSGAAKQVADEAELMAVLAELIASKETRAALGRAAAAAVSSKRGAAARTLAALEEVYLSRLGQKSNSR